MGLTQHCQPCGCQGAGDRLDGKPAQAIAIKGDPDSPVIFNLRLGDGLKTIEHEPAPEALTAPLVAIAAQGDEG